MTSRLTYFEQVDLSVRIQDDGVILVYIIDEGDPLGILPLSADTAINLGNILITRGTSVKDQLNEAEEPVTEEPAEEPVTKSDIWRDVKGGIWCSEDGSYRLHPKGIHPEVFDISWDDLQEISGPLTRVVDLNDT